MSRSADAAWIIVLLGGLAACSSSAASASAPGPAHGAPETAGGAGSRGTVGLELTIASGVVIDLVVYTLSGPHAFSQNGTINVANSSAVSAIIGGIPPGSGYVFSLTGTSTDGAFTCTGQSQPFSVQPQQTTAVVLALSCGAAAPDAGSVNVTATTASCPAIDQISVLPANAMIGGSMSVLGSARGLDPTALTYSWTATSGTLSNTSVPNPTFTCTAVGSPMISLTVSDGSDAAGCTPTASVTVSCTN